MKINLMCVTPNVPMIENAKRHFYNTIQYLCLLSTHSREREREIKSIPKHNVPKSIRLVPCAAATCGKHIAHVAKT